MSSVTGVVISALFLACFMLVAGIGRSYSPIPFNPLNSPRISADGRYVVFSTADATFIPDDNNMEEDVYIWDTFRDHNNNSFWRASVSTSENEGWGRSFDPVISPDSYHVFYNSYSVNLLDGTVLTPVISRVWHYNMTSELPTTSLVSTMSDTTPLNGNSFLCGCSYDGTRVLFQSEASNSIPQGVQQLNPNAYNVYLKDLTTGDLRLVSTNIFGNETATKAATCIGSSTYHNAPRALSFDGKWAVFSSTSTNLDALNRKQDGTYEDVFVANLDTGEIQVVSTSIADRENYKHCRFPAIAGNATRVAFVCNRDGSGALVFPIFICDFSSDIMENATCRIASITPSGEPSNTTYTYYSYPDISADGRYVVYTSNPLDIIDDPLYNAAYSHVLLFDTVTNTTTWISKSHLGYTNDGSSYDPSISADGRYIAFVSTSTTLVPETINFTRVAQVYVFDTATNKTIRATPPSCFFPTQEECDKMRWQLDKPALYAVGALGDVFAYVSKSIGVVDNEPPSSLFPNDNDEYLFIYLRFRNDFYTSIVHDTDAPLQFVAGIEPKISDTGELLVYKAQTPPTADFHANNCSSTLFLYDTISMKHTLIPRPAAPGECPQQVGGHYITKNGKYVVFHSRDKLDVVDPTPYIDTQIYVYTVSTGALSLETGYNSTYYPYLPLQDIPNHFNCYQPHITESGRYLVTACTLSFFHIVLRDRTTNDPGVVLTITPDGIPFNFSCDHPQITNDAQFVVALCHDWDKNNLFPGVYSEFESMLLIIDLKQPANSPSRFRVARVPPYVETSSMTPHVAGIMVPTDYDKNPLGEGFFVAFNAFLPFQQPRMVGCLYFYDNDTTTCFDVNKRIADISADGRYLVLYGDGLQVPYDVNGVTDVFHYDRLDGTFELVSAHNNWFTPLPDTLFDCPGVRPAPRFECIDGIWYMRAASSRTIVRTPVIIKSNTTASLSGNSTVVTGTLNVGCNGTLYMVNSTLLVVEDISICGLLSFPISDEVPLVTQKCMVFDNGTLHIDASTIDLENSGPGRHVITLATYTCHRGSLGGYTVDTANVSECKEVTTSLSYEQNELLLVFNIDDSKCHKAAGLTVLYVLIPIVLVGIFIAIALAVPAVRNKIFPFARRGAEGDQIVGKNQVEMQDKYKI